MPLWQISKPGKAQTGWIQLPTSMFVLRLKSTSREKSYEMADFWAGNIAWKSYCALMVHSILNSVSSSLSPSSYSITLSRWTHLLYRGKKHREEQPQTFKNQLYKSICLRNPYPFPSHYNVIPSPLLLILILSQLSGNFMLANVLPLYNNFNLSLWCPSYQQINIL